MTGFTCRHDSDRATVEVASRIPTVGERVDFEVRSTGKRSGAATGSPSTHEVREVALALETRYRTPDGYRSATLHRQTLASGLPVEACLTETRTTTVQVPYETPSTVGSVDVWATLTFDLGATTAEREVYFDVGPTAGFHAVFDAAFDLGFALRDAECLADRTTDGPPFVRRFEFSPTSGPFRGRFDDLELFVRTGPESVTLLAAVDRDATWRPVPASDEARTVVRSTDPGEVRDHLRSFVEGRIDS